VLHARCVDLAAAYRVPLTVRSAFDESPGTEITEDVMEGARVEAVTHRDSCSIAIAEGNAGGRGEARGLIEAVSERLPDLDLIAHEQASDAHAVVVWIGEREGVDSLQSEFRALRGPGGEWKLRVEHGAAFVSLVGLGLGAREAAQAERALEKRQVPLIALRVTPVALVFRVPGGRCADAVQALHAEFLEREPAGKRS
jgi:aspartokinase